MLWELASSNPQSDRDALILVETILENHCKSEGFLGSRRMREAKMQEVVCLTDTTFLMDKVIVCTACKVVDNIVAFKKKL